MQRRPRHALIGQSLDEHGEMACGEWPAPLVITIAYMVVAYHSMVFK
jgi:hypothetical protein